MEWDGNSYTIEELTEDSFAGTDIALFSAGGSISKKFGPIASDAGCTVRQCHTPCKWSHTDAMSRRKESSPCYTLMVPSSHFKCEASFASPSNLLMNL